MPVVQERSPTAELFVQARLDCRRHRGPHTPTGLEDDEVTELFDELEGQAEGRIDAAPRATRTLASWAVRRSVSVLHTSKNMQPMKDMSRMGTRSHARLAGQDAAEL
jgi:hypothetical protein